MIVTEKRVVKIARSCNAYPFYVRFLNSKGGVDFWLFHWEYDRTLTTEERGTFEPSIEDLETARGRVFDWAIFSQPQYVVRSMVPNEDTGGIERLLDSISVELLLNPDTWESEGVKWRTMRPVKGSFRIISTTETESLIEVTFNRPYNSVQRR